MANINLLLQTNGHSDRTDTISRGHIKYSGREETLSLALLITPILSFEPHITLSQTTNFRLFQTDRVCRIQFQI